MPAEAVCEMCGEALPPPAGPGGRPRRWCSDTCRKAQYGGRCVDCGARTDGSGGPGHAPSRCNVCTPIYLRHNSGRAERVLAMVALRNTAGANNRALAERFGISPVTVAMELSRMRSLGFSVALDPGAKRPPNTIPSARSRDGATTSLAAELAVRGITPEAQERA